MAGTPRTSPLIREREAAILLLFSAATVAGRNTTVVRQAAPVAVS